MQLNLWLRQVGVEKEIIISRFVNATLAYKALKILFFYCNFCVWASIFAQKVQMRNSQCTQRFSGDVSP